MPKRETKLYILDIDVACKDIIKYSKDLSFEEFKKDRKTQQAIERNLEIIGEAAAKLPASFRKQHSSVPWKEIISMRNKVIHEYFGVDKNILWQTIKGDIPVLKKEITKIRREQKDQSLF